MEEQWRNNDRTSGDARGVHRIGEASQMDNPSIGPKQNGPALSACGPARSWESINIAGTRTTVDHGGTSGRV